MRREHQVLLSSVGAACVASARNANSAAASWRRRVESHSAFWRTSRADWETSPSRGCRDVARALGSSAGELLFAAQHERTDRRVVALVGLRARARAPSGRRSPTGWACPSWSSMRLVERTRASALSHLPAPRRGVLPQARPRGADPVPRRDRRRGDRDGRRHRQPIRVVQAAAERCRTVWLQATPRTIGSACSSRATSGPERRARMPRKSCGRCSSRASRCTPKRRSRWIRRGWRSTARWRRSPARSREAADGGLGLRRTIRFPEPLEPFHGPPTPLLAPHPGSGQEQEEERQTKDDDQEVTTSGVTVRLMCARSRGCAGGAGTAGHPCLAVRTLCPDFKLVPERAPPRSKGRVRHFPLN